MVLRVTVCVGMTGNLANQVVRAFRTGEWAALRAWGVMTLLALLLLVPFFVRDARAAAQARKRRALAGIAEPGHRHA
jgi:hypothetical protein